MILPEFSPRTRSQALSRFEREHFDLLVIGGGIVGAGVARDAAYRGLSVALVEAHDFASGTSSASSKLVHGGLRYLENFELGLVFEALSERALLLRTVPTMVRPLPFYMPVYQGDARGMTVLSAGLWLYDALSLFRTPGMHQRLSKSQLKHDIPFLKRDGLKGGFRYYDASMWDDVLTIETLRDAHAQGVAAANYCPVFAPIWDGDFLRGAVVKAETSGLPTDSREISIHAEKVIVCGGPWTDRLGSMLARRPDGSGDWRPWLAPSKGVHLIFDLKRIPVPGAMVMSHPVDKRISFVIPRPDYGAGVTIVGTTDGPCPADPADVHVESSDLDYLFDLLNRYFPDLKLTSSDILSAYVGVRPLVGQGDGLALQKVSREHHIAEGPGHSVFVAGGKYTTYRKMAEEIVDYAMTHWRPRDEKHFTQLKTRQRRDTRAPLNSAILPEAIERAEELAQSRGAQLPAALLERFGAAALDILDLDHERPGQGESPAGYPMVEAQLRYSVRTEMVLHLEDFYLRRQHLFATRQDHGLPWAERLASVWGEELGITDPSFVAAEVARLKAQIASREAWRRNA